MVVPRIQNKDSLLQTKGGAHLDILISKGPLHVACCNKLRSTSSKLLGTRIPMDALLTNAYPRAVHPAKRAPLSVPVQTLQTTGTVNSKLGSTTQSC